MFLYSFGLHMSLQLDWYWTVSFHQMWFSWNILQLSISIQYWKYLTYWRSTIVGNYKSWLLRCSLVEKILLTSDSQTWLKYLITPILSASDRGSRSNIYCSKLHYIKITPHIEKSIECLFILSQLKMFWIARKTSCRWNRKVCSFYHVCTGHILSDGKW